MTSAVKNKASRTKVYEKKELSKSDVEKIIKDKWPAKKGEKLKICWMDKWEHHYLLNYWVEKDEKTDLSMVKSYRINRSINVVIFDTEEGVIAERYPTSQKEIKR